MENSWRQEEWVAWRTLKDHEVGLDWKRDGPACQVCGQNTTVFGQQVLDHCSVGMWESALADKLWQYFQW